jgi:signal recognition particle receptor subunit beta
MKILIAGGAGAGRTAFVGAVSEIDPLRTEELLFPPAVPGGLREAEPTATVALDLGRITIGDDLVLYLFGTPGGAAPGSAVGARPPAGGGLDQHPEAPIWEDLASGALGAVVIADARRLADCVPSIDYFVRRGTPFLVAVNDFDGLRHLSVERVRHELRLAPHVPVMVCDVRDRRSGREVLVNLVQLAGRQPRQRAR